MRLGRWAMVAIVVAVAALAWAPSSHALSIDLNCTIGAGQGSCAPSGFDYGQIDITQVDSDSVQVLVTINGGTKWSDLMLNINTIFDDTGWSVTGLNAADFDVSLNGHSPDGYCSSAGGCFDIDAGKNLGNSFAFNINHTGGLSDTDFDFLDSAFSKITAAIHIQSCTGADSNETVNCVGQGGSIWVGGTTTTTDTTVTIVTIPVPEPSALMLLGSGLLSLGFGTAVVRRFRRK